MRLAHHEKLTLEQWHITLRFPRLLQAIAILVSVLGKPFRTEIAVFLSIDNNRVNLSRERQRKNIKAWNSVAAKSPQLSNYCSDL